MMDAVAQNVTAEQNQYFIDSSDEKVTQVFSNPLIWNVLGRHLGYLDLKECRMVCSGFNKMISEETDFYRRTVIDLTDVSSRFPETWRLVKWKHVYIDVSRFSRLLQFDEIITEEKNERSGEEEGDKVGMEGLTARQSAELMGLMKNMESLYLYSSCEATGQIIMDLLEFASFLKKLCIDFTNITSIELSEPRSMKLKLLDTLEEIELKATPLSYGLGAAGYPYKVVGNAEKIMQLLQHPNSKLQIIKIKKLLPKLRLVTSDESRRILLNCCELLLSFVKQHASQLLELEIRDPTFWAIMNELRRPPLRDDTAPLLKSITAEAIDDPWGVSAENLANYISTQTDLQEVRIKFTNAFPQALFDAVRTRGHKLKKLSIVTKIFLVREDGMWDFLTDTKIEEFELVLKPMEELYRDTGSVNAIFANLPNTMKRVVIRGFPVRMSATPFIDFHNINPGLLSELELSKCGGLVADDTVQLICKNFNVLRKLDISTAQRVTDYGLTGKHDDMAEQEGATGLAVPIAPEKRSGEGETTGVNISNLKELEHLNLRCCSGISDRTLTDGIKFLRLQFLDLSGIHNVTAEACRLLKSGIPRLKLLRESVPLVYTQRRPPLPKLSSCARDRLRSLSLDSFPDD